MRKAFVLILSWALLVNPGPVVAHAGERPLLGAQIWIEPGQTPDEIDGWFRELANSHMPVARLFLMWAYLEPRRDQWDFTEYDEAFKAAEKYHVRIVATLTPSGPPPFRGGDGSQGESVVPGDAKKPEAAEYIAKVVEHYRSSSALDTWLILNEPAQSPASNPSSDQAFRLWLAQQYPSIESLNTSWGTSYASFDDAKPPTPGHVRNHTPELDWRMFWQGYQTSQLRWLADQVRKADSNHPLHLNPAGLLENLASVSNDLPSWRGFLDTLGCSIHPPWHFGLLNRDQFALGVSYVNDLVRSSIEPKPYWVTELQGGDNIYSGRKPMEPSPEDIAQWVWTSVGSGADRVIFWLLNARAEGTEAAEWSLLDFQQKPSYRLRTASEIATVLDRQQSFFSRARPMQSGVTVILSRDTMMFEDTFHAEDDAARGINAHGLEALGFYEALSRLGQPPRVKYFDDFDWDTKTAERRIVILPDVREVTEQQIAALNQFVTHGNILLISGLTGFYGPHAIAWPLAGFPLSKITGGRLKEVHNRVTTPFLSLGNPSIALPSRLWVSSILAESSQAIGREGDEVIASERIAFGGGKVIWIPSPIGLGAWLTDARPLANYLNRTLSTLLKRAPFIFPHPESGCLLRTLEDSQGSYVTVVTNGDGVANRCSIVGPAGLHPTTLWGAPSKRIGMETIISLPPRGTFVGLWR